MVTNDSTYMTYSAWVADGFDASSRIANPNLDSTYHLGSGSSAIGIGMNLTSLNITALDSDKAGNLRSSASTTNWDGGVYDSNAPSPAINLTGTAQPQ